MKIGIGITTFRRPSHLALCMRQIGLNTPEDVTIYIARDTDEDHRGVAYRKNECLRNLKDCDYIYLFDDDCFPINVKWTEFFIEQHKQSGQHHFIYTKEGLNNRLVEQIGNINVFSDANGCFMFLTKEVVEKVGAFNEQFGIYGYEHAEYSYRVMEAGLIKHAYECPVNTDAYIYSLDIDQHRFDIDHKPSLSGKEMREAELVARQSFKKPEYTYLPL